MDENKNLMNFIPVWLGIFVCLAIHVTVTLILSICVVVFDGFEVEFFDEWYLITGMLYSIPLIVIILYIKYIMRFSKFENIVKISNMKILNWLAILPFVFGVEDYYHFSWGTTICLPNGILFCLSSRLLIFLIFILYGVYELNKTFVQSD